MVQSNQYGGKHVNASGTEGDESITVLEHARREAGLTMEELGEVLGVTGQAAGRYCSARDHSQHRRPRDPEVRRRLRDWSGGAITSDNCDDDYAPPKKRRARQPERAR